MSGAVAVPQVHAANLDVATIDGVRIVPPAGKKKFTGDLGARPSPGADASLLLIRGMKVPVDEITDGSNIIHYDSSYSLRLNDSAGGIKCYVASVDAIKIKPTPISQCGYRLPVGDTAEAADNEVNGSEDLPHSIPHTKSGSYKNLAGESPWEIIGKIVGFVVGGMIIKLAGFWTAIIFSALCVLAGWFASKVIRPPRELLPAVAVVGGQIIGVFLAGLLIGRPEVLFDVVVLAAGVAWLVGRPGIPPVVGLCLYQTASLLYRLLHLGEHASIDVGAVFLIANGLAIFFLLRCLSQLPNNSQHHSSNERPG